MRKALLMLGLMVALAVPAAATAAPPHVLCGPGCNNTGGYTGCTTASNDHSANVGVASIRHYLVVSYCKQYGIITSVSIAAHGCDTSGLATCSTGPAWQASGGVGSTSATFEAHASWGVTINPFVTSYDVVYVTVPAG